MLLGTGAKSIEYVVGEGRQSPLSVSHLQTRIEPEDLLLAHSRLSCRLLSLKTSAVQLFDLVPC